MKSTKCQSSECQSQDLARVASRNCHVAEHFSVTEFSPPQRPDCECPRGITGYWGCVVGAENGVVSLFTPCFVRRQIIEQIIKHALFNVLMTCYNSGRSSFCPNISLSMGRGSLSLNTSSWASAHSHCFVDCYSHIFQRITPSSQVGGYT